MKASILGIGTELTSGQILNSNAHWIAQKLKLLGVETVHHIVVPDERELILKALKFCSDPSIEFIFITGGLGPTSDDFTRDLVAEFWQKKMIFDESSWDYICDRLKQRGVPVREMQKQQCYFPEDCQILTNAQGTAHGFYFKNQVPNNLQNIFVLPGPPREIDCIWKDHIDFILQKLTHHINRQTTLTWDCLGISEPELAHLMEEICAPFKSWVEIGYRVHPPYVECKIIFHESNRTHIERLINKIESDLSQWIVLRNGEDAVGKLIEKLKNFNLVEIEDSASNGLLLQRLCPQILKQKFALKIYQDNVLNLCGSSQPDRAEHIRLKFKKNESNHFECQIQTKNKSTSHEILSPFSHIATLQDRHLQYCIEKAILIWSQEIQM